MNPAKTMAPMQRTNTSYKPIEMKPSSQPQATHHRSQWNKTSSMFGSLFIGVLLAVGHAVFYWWLNGKKVDETLSQTWVTNIGTAFAFIFKMFLVISAGIAFAQHQWRNLKAQTFEVEQIDTVTTMTEDIFSLLDVRLWARVPTLVIIAAITWLIPVAAVFPPGTLRIAFRATDHVNQLQVPQLALTNNSNYYVNSGTAGTNSYADAAAIVYTAALATGTGGRILDLPHVNTNMTYNMQFYAPAIQCSNASTDLRDLAVSHINTTGSGGGIFYISFVGGGDVAQGMFNASGLDCSNEAISGTCSRPAPEGIYSTDYETLDMDSTDTARLYVMLGLNLTECQLFNASYNVDFDFGPSAQTVIVRELDMQNPVAYNRSTQQTCYAGDSLHPDCMNTSTIGSYQATMQAFGSMYVGALTGHYSLYTRYQTLIQTLSTTPNYTAANVNFTYDVPGFQKGMETQFQNITLSMLSFQDLM